MEPPPGFLDFSLAGGPNGASCREAIRQAQALCLASDQPCPPSTTSPYCQARASCPWTRLDQSHRAVVQESEQALGAGSLWCGRRVLVVDGTTVTAPDTPENQQAYPQQSAQRPGCGFPIIRLAALLNLATGMLVAWAACDWRQSELGLLAALWDYLQPGDVLWPTAAFATGLFWPDAGKAALRRSFGSKDRGAGIFAAAKRSAPMNAWRVGTNPSSDPRPSALPIGRNCPSP